MSYIDAAMLAVHLIFAAVWIGSVAYVTFAVLPLARDGDLDRAPLRRLIGRAVTTARLGAVVMLVTGAHLMGTRGDYYDTEVLLSTGRGLAVVAMVLLWLALIVLVEVGGRRIRSGLDAHLVQEPARDGLTWFYTATLVGVLLLVDGALLAVGGVL